jgi:hypothetical protein
MYLCYNVKLFLANHMHESPDSTVGVATGYVLEGQGLNPGRGKAGHPDRLLGPPSLLSNAYRGWND